jgi:hypothetical protein
MFATNYSAHDPVFVSITDTAMYRRRIRIEASITLTRA